MVWNLGDLDTLLISTGTIREVPDQAVRACRTQIVTEIESAAGTGDMMTLPHRVSSMAIIWKAHGRP